MMAAQDVTDPPWLTSTKKRQTGLRGGSLSPRTLSPRAPSPRALSPRPTSPGHGSQLVKESRSSRPSRSSSRMTSKSGSCSNEDEVDEDWSELVGAVRQYAKEIHDIYAPIKQEEEERHRKRHERQSRRKSKDLNQKNGLSVRQEVRVEVHGEKSESFHAGRQLHLAEHNQNAKNSDRLTPNFLAASSSRDQRLSRSWPGRHQQLDSPDRLWSEGNTKIDNNTHYTSSVNASAVSKSKIRNDWNDTKNIQQEKEILTKALQRFQNGEEDPLIASLGRARHMPNIHEQLLDSRQSVIEVAKQHRQRRNSVLPSISIISPPSHYRNKSHNSEMFHVLAHQDGGSQDGLQRAASTAGDNLEQSH